jgi:hypothetical protein
VGIGESGRRGARFTATIQHTHKGPQASFAVYLDAPGETLVQNGGPELFGTDAEAERWLKAEAAARGFSTFPIERIS